MKKIQNILFVDDDTISSYINRAVLEEMQVAENLHWLNDGQEALEYLKERCAESSQHAYACNDLIFLDLNMPQINGFEFLESLQQLRGINTLKLYIVMLTSSWHSRDMEKARSYAIQDYLIKPLTAEKVAEVVRKYHSHMAGLV